MIEWREAVKIFEPAGRADSDGMSKFYRFCLRFHILFCSLSPGVSSCLTLWAAPSLYFHTRRLSAFQFSWWPTEAVDHLQLNNCKTIFVSVSSMVNEKKSSFLLWGCNRTFQNYSRTWPLRSWFELEHHSSSSKMTFDYVIDTCNWTVEFRNLLCPEINCWRKSVLGL